MRIHRKIPPITRLLRKTYKGDGSGCWVWMGFRKKEMGYGKIRVGSKSLYAHRVSYESFVGKIPHGLFVLHKCDNPPCVRPDHLFLGTLAENIKDCASKKRISAGENHYKSKVNDDIVRDIRLSYKHGNGTKLANKYGVSRTTINEIVHRKVWGHVSDS